MRKIIMILVLLISSYSYAQCGWFCTYPYPTNNDLNSISILDSTTAIAVGNDAEVLITTNSGINWMNKLSCSKDKINAVQFVNQSTCYAGGTDFSSRGIIYKTTNQGANWSKRIVSEYISINSISFVNDNFGFAAGGGGANLFRTTNGGVNWSYIVNSMNINIKSVCFIDPITGYAGGNVGDSTKLYKSTNGGLNWNIIYSLSYTVFYSLEIVDSNTAFFSGRAGISPFFYTPVLYKTTNGGLNWTYISTNYYMYTIHFKTPSLGFAAGYNSVGKTTNGGANWTFLTIPSINTSIKFSDDNSGYSVGNNGLILKSTNNGTNWSKISQTHPDSYVNRIQFCDINIGFAVTYSQILKTTDSGNSWQSIFDSNVLYDEAVINEDTIFVCGTNGIFRTINGGSNWINQINPGYSLKAISFLNSKIGYCSGTNNDGILMKTTNGGLNWITFTVDFSAWGGGNIVIINQNVIFINSWSRTLKSTNGGLNWFNVSHPGFGIHNLFFIDINTGFAVGYDFSIYKTTNSGIYWTNKYNNPNSAYVNSIHFLNSMTGFAGGDRGILLKTINAGENWYEVYSPSSNDVNTVLMQDTDIINIGGSQFIYKTIEGVIPIKVLNNNIVLPRLFSLSQNYPNPFNPQTKIKFAVPKASFTKLVIYDLLGREVTTLLNEELKPGTYEADWDGSNFSSGVYFYKLVAGDFVETNKMVLMK